MNTSNIILNSNFYYIPNRWAGSSVKIKVTEILNESWVMVETQKRDKFRWKAKYIYQSDKAAIAGYYEMCKDKKKHNSKQERGAIKNRR